MKTVAIAGASGYVGGELLRLVAAHPELKLVAATANANAGATIGSLHPHLTQFAAEVLKETTPEALATADIVFLALPHTTSAEVASWLREDQIVLDCGADFRLESAEQWVKFYGTEHQGTWTYGMPELVLADGTKQRDVLKGAKRISVPGCNVTAITLALAPLAKAGVIELDDIVSVLSVGTSGAGRTLKSNLLASEVSGSASAYGVGGVHRHTPEIEQNLGKAAGSTVKVSFTPVLVPMSRGILAVNTATLKSGDARAALEAAYQGETFVKLLPAGEFPATSSTLGVNTCLIGVAVDEHANRVVVVSAIDNLVKGTAGAAIQSLNISLGFAEDTGLSVNGVAP
jgi:N-acetyl-gamma-glutamyl-phosphate reductase